MAACIVNTRLDCRNALSHGATEKSLNKLQIVQNKFARVVCKVTTRQQNTIGLLRNLHWLPIKSRITFKVTILVLQSIQDPSTTLYARHIGALRATPCTKIC